MAAKVMSTSRAIRTFLGVTKLFIMIDISILPDSHDRLCPLYKQRPCNSLCVFTQGSGGVEWGTLSAGGLERPRTVILPVGFSQQGLMQLGAASRFRNTPRSSA